MANYVEKPVAYNDMEKPVAYNDMAHTITLIPGEVAVNEGGTVYTYPTGYEGNDTPPPPITKAVIATRLRVLANLIEGSE